MLIIAADNNVIMSMLVQQPEALSTCGGRRDWSVCGLVLSLRRSYCRSLWTQRPFGRTASCSASGPQMLHMMRTLPLLDVVYRFYVHIALQVAEAVYYFGKSKRTNNGVRLAKKHGMDQELLSLALQASPLQPLCVVRAQHCLEALSNASWLLWLHHCGTVSQIAVVTAVRLSLSLRSTQGLWDEAGACQPGTAHKGMMACYSVFEEVLMQPRASGGQGEYVWACIVLRKPLRSPELEQHIQVYIDKLPTLHESSCVESKPVRCAPSLTDLIV